MSHPLIERLEQSRKRVEQELDAALVVVRGSQEFRDAVFALLEGTPFAAPEGTDYEGLYGRLRDALKVAPAGSPAPPTTEHE